MKYKFDENLLTNEKSLWDIYIQSRKISGSWFQNLLVFSVASILSLNVFFLESDISVLLGNVRAWAEIGFSFAITTLGFLIAGFTIFATLSKPDMMLAMMDHIHRETKLPTLKYNFFVFMKVFIFYILFSVLYLFIILFGQSGGVVSNLFKFIPEFDCLTIIIIKLSYIFVGTSFIYLVLLLKGFVFNIYAIVMNFLRWEYHVNSSDNDN
jgi:hypothetical protein